MKKISLLSVTLLSMLLFVHYGSAQTTIKVNEIYSRGVAGNLDWVEVYNTSAAQVDISGFKIYDGGGRTGTKPKKLFSAGTILPAKGFAIVVVDTASFAGDQSGFGLSNSGDSVWVENAAGMVIDSVFIPALGTDTTYGRIPDGSSRLMKITPTTKGFSNVAIKMNEIYSQGVAGALDWIEIYNASSASINIGGYKIYDIGGQSGTKGKKVISAGTILPAKGFTFVVTDTASFAGDTTAFGLSNGGETVWLENAVGVVIDTVAFPALGKDTSYARKPDGSNLFVKASPTTKNASNGSGTSVRQIGVAVESYSLQQNYPNPFNPSTMIEYRLSTSSHVTLKVFDLLGKEIAVLVNGKQDAGAYAVRFDASSCASGMYFYRLNAGSYSEMRKMLFVK